MPDRNGVMSLDPLLECTEIRKTYTNGKRSVEVLTGVNLRVSPGQICIVSGPSGAGKSTLLSILGALDRPTAGQIKLNKQRLDTCSEWDLALIRRQQIGFIFQEAGLLPSWTAFENVEAALMHAGPKPTERRDKVNNLLTTFGLASRADHLPTELSAGQKQRVAIARALINQPKLILADEPTGNVDPETAAEIVQLLTEIARNLRTAIIIATHGVYPSTGAEYRLQLRNGNLYPAAS